LTQIRRPTGARIVRLAAQQAIRNSDLLSASPLGMIAAMQPQPHRKHRRWRRFLRSNQGLFFACFATIIVLGLVALLFIFLTHPYFAKSG